MKPELAPIRVSIIDFMGVLLPGIIWVILFWSFEELFDQAPYMIDPNPLTLGVHLFGFGDGNGLMRENSLLIDMGAKHYIGFAVSALMLGYIVRPLTARIADRVSFGWDRFRVLFCRERPADICELAFPFTAKLRSEPYFVCVLDLVRTRAGLEPSGLPSHQPLESCKALLRVHARTLWESVEHIEGEVTLVGSLLVACLFSILVVAVKLVLARWPLGPSLGWLASSCALAVMLFASYRRLRRLEVDLVYMNTLLAKPLIEATDGAA